MKKSFIFFAIALLFLCAFSFQSFYCDTSVNNPEIRYQVDQFFPPYEYAKDGQIYGFDIELGRLIFNGAPYDVEYSSDVWSNVYRRIKDKETDICGLISINEKRKKDLLFSNTVIQTYRAVYGLKSLKFDSLDDLKNYRIGVQKSDYSETILSENLHILNYTTFKNYEECVLALKEGDIDVVFGNQDVIHYFLVKNQLNQDIVAHLSNLFPANMAYGVSMDRPELVDFINTRISELRQSGAFEAIYQKHFHGHSNYSEEAKRQKNAVIIFLCLLIGISIIGLSQYVIHKLRKIVERTTKELQEEHEWLSVTLASIGDAVIATDEKGNISFINPSAVSLTGYGEEESLHQPISEILKIIHNDTGEAALIPVIEVIEKRITIKLSTDCSLIAKSGKKIPISDSASPIYSKNGEFIGVVMVFQDITEKVEAEKTLLHHAYHDYLTNLPNRRSFINKLDKVLSTPEINKCLSVIFMDLDNFKSINDNMGHDSGDTLLYEIGQRLFHSVENNSFMARMGGDEFAILIEDICGVEEIEAIAKNILKHFAEPFIIEGIELDITPSIGISYYEDTLSTAREMLKLADKAMYKSKEKGKNSYTILLA